MDFFNNICKYFPIPFFVITALIHFSCITKKEIALVASLDMDTIDAHKRTIMNS